MATATKMTTSTAAAKPYVAPTAAQVIAAGGSFYTPPAASSSSSSSSSSGGSSGGGTVSNPTYTPPTTVGGTATQTINGQTSTTTYLGNGQYSTTFAPQAASSTPVSAASAAAGITGYTSGGAAIYGANAPAVTSGAVLSPYVNTAGPINADLMKPVTPVVLPPKKQGTADAGNIEFAAATTASLKDKLLQESKDKAEAARLKVDSSAKSIEQIFNDLGNQGAVKEQAYKENGVDEARMQVDELTSQIEAEQQALKKQTDLIRGTGGMTQEQADSQIAALERQSYSKQADIAVILNMSNRRYDTARAIADRQVEAKLEPLKYKLEAQQFIYQQNVDILNTEERRVFDEVIKQSDQQYATARNAEEELKETKLSLLQSAVEQKAPIVTQNAIWNAKTPQDAIRAAGVYNGKLPTVKTTTNPKDPKEKALFTQSQLNDGAVKSGASIDSFVGLDKDVQNFFVNSSTDTIDGINLSIGDVTSGADTADNIKALINDRPWPASVKSYWLNKLEAAAPKQTITVKKTLGQGAKEMVNKLWDSIFN